MHIFKSLLLLLLFLYTSLYAKERSLEKVTLQLQWKHQFEFAGFYAAKEKGFYADVGLDVNFAEFDKTKNISNEVLNGNAQYGLTYSSIIAEYLNGKPFILLANFFKQSPLVLVTQSDIKSPADLKNKRVMGISDSIDNITILTMLNKFDIHSNNIIDVPASFTIDDFVNKKVDAMSVFTTNELYDLNKKGIKYNLLDPVAYGAKYYDANLFTTQNELKEHPERVKNFTEASIKGWKYALAHQDELIEIIIQKYNTQKKSKEALRFEAKQIEYIMLPEVYEVGSIDIDRIRTITESFIQAGFIDSVKNTKIEDFIYAYTKDPLNLKNPLGLTKEEKQYLQKNKNIKMCVDPDWMPFEMIKNNTYIGLGSDYMKLISDKISTPITLMPTATWKSSIALFKEKQCDILPLAMETKTRKEFMNVTKAYLTAPLVISTTNDKFFISSISELQNKKIGIVSNYAHFEVLKHKYPSVVFVKVATVADGLKKVVQGTLFGFIDSLPTIGYQIQKRFPKTLKITGQLNEKLELGIAVQKDNTILLNILNKAVNAVGEKKKQNILNEWISIQYDKKINYSFLWYLLSAILLVAMVILIKQYELNKYNKRLKLEVEEKIEELRGKDEILIKKQRMAAMGEMLSMIAHQWRQPLSAINFALMGIEVKLGSNHYDMEKKEDRDACLRYLEQKHQSINEYIQHLSATTDDFRNFFNPNKKSDIVSLTLPIDNALKLLQSSLQRKGIEIIQDLKIAPELMMYQNEVMQVVLNILKNSESNFMEKKILDPKITIKTFFRHSHAVISICDNGGGIADEIAANIFEPYFSTKDEKNGAGLGLYMSKTIIEKHHKGTLIMQNQEDGVCFEITFYTDK